MTPPTTVRLAVTTWMVAVGCGVAESFLAAFQAASQNSLGPDMVSQLGIRFVVYLLATVLIFQFRRGRRWARSALTVLLTIIGFAAMVVPATVEIAGGQPFFQAFGGGGTLGWAFPVVRLTHITCVVVASTLMFTAVANRYFVTSRRPITSPTVVRGQG